MKKIGIIMLATFGFLTLGASSEPVASEEPSIAEESSFIYESEALTSEEESLPSAFEEKEEEPDYFSEFVKEYFNADKVAMYFSWLAYIGTIIGFVAQFKKLKKENNLTLDGVLKELTKIIEKVVGEKVAEQFGKVTPNILAGQDNSNKVMTIFAKVLALSQENTPESRLAILDLIGELGTVAKELVDNAKGTIVETVKLEQVAKEESEKKLDEIIDKYDGTSI